MESKVKISISITEKTEQILQELGKVLVNGVQLSRGDVVDFLAAEKASALEKVRRTALEAVPDDTLAGWEKGEAE